MHPSTSSEGSSGSSDAKSTMSTSESTATDSGSTGSEEPTGTDDDSETTGGEEPPNLDPGPVACTKTECSVTCDHVEYDLDEGEVCECTQADAPEGWVECVLPTPCAGANDLARCVAQGVRYNMPGAYELEAFNGADSHLTRYEVFGAELVRSISSSSILGCCSNSVGSLASYRFPQSTTEPKNLFWDDCKAEAGGSCFDEDLLFPEQSCQPMLEACPRIEELGQTCEESCPMAGDGICDEEAGTGLCAPGCDPLDCS